MVAVADNFGLKITESDIFPYMRGKDIFKPKKRKNIEKITNIEFVSIMIYLYIMSFKSFPVCEEKYLSYLDTIFQHKFKNDQLRISDIFLYEVFTERMS